MSHDLDMTTGNVAMAYVGEQPWHRLGEKLPEGQPIEAWLKAARLDWLLEKLPVQYFFDGELRTMDDRFVLARSDSGTALSVVSGDYHVVQPREVLEFYRDLIELYGYQLETAGALDGGRKVWALARTGLVGEPQENSGDKMAAYVLLATSCDKTLATTAAFTSIRVVCQNTLFFAMKDVAKMQRPQIKIPHSFRFDAEKAKTDLGLLDEAWATFIAKVRAMAARPMAPQEIAAFFESLLLPPKAKELSAKAQREKVALMSLSRSAPGQQLLTAKETLWGELNAVTYYVDHARAGTAADRLDSAWFGSGNILKEKAWDMAITLLQ
jgi:phage/plasmid-like protein (TIGR03299 family)